jgi:glycosyltransferase involved in cell wall biosynthesis
MQRIRRRISAVAACVRRGESTVVVELRDETPTTVCFPFLGRTFGGSHRSALLLIENLPAPFRPQIAVHEDGPLTDALRTRGLPYERVPLLYVPNSGSRRIPQTTEILLNVPRLHRFLRAHAVNIVHGNDGRMNTTWGIPARLAGARLVWHQRAHFAQSHFGNTFLRLPHAVIGITDYAIENLPQAAARKSTVVTNPFRTDGALPDRSAARAALCSRLSVAPDAPLVGYLANFTYQKRPVVFLEALLRVAQNEPRVVGVMAGEPREPQASVVRQRCADAGFERQLHIIGFHDAPEQYLAAIDVLLAPGVEEGHGRTLVEAMCVGTPVVAARSGGTAEVIEHGQTGMLVEPDDVAGFAEATGRLLQSPDLAARLAATAKERALAGFTVGRHVDRIVSLYRQLLAQR